MQHRHEAAGGRQPAEEHDGEVEDVPGLAEAPPQKRPVTEDPQQMARCHLYSRVSIVGPPLPGRSTATARRRARRT